MARPIPDDQDDAVLEALRRAPQGAGMEQIEAALSNPPPRRTLQRRMAALVAQGRVRMVGQRRAARYFSGNVVHGSGRQIFALTTTLRAEIRIPLSHEAQDALPNVPWKEVTGMRNRLAHAYFDIDLDILWRTAREAVPDLLEKLAMFQETGN